MSKRTASKKAVRGPAGRNSLGLDARKCKALVQSLNGLLASYQVHYQNLRGCHWNITGPAFFELHVKFEELYTKAQNVIDELAERILTLEGRPLHTFTAYLRTSTIDEQQDLTGAGETVRSVMNGMTKLIALQRGVLSLADEAGDEATATLIGDNITVMEKDLWMLRAYSAK